MGYGRKLMLDFEEREIARQGIVKELLIWTACIAGTILLAYLIINCFFEKTTMLDVSMETTLEKDSKIIINKFSYILGKPDRFDVVVFELEGKEHSFYNIKRVIGLPGESVQIKDGQVYIDGKEINEKVNVEAIVNSGLAEDEIVLEKDQYFVLGDNRNNSEDSRFATVGFIKKDDIIGKAWIKLKPLEFISKLNEVVLDEDSDKKDDKK